MKRLAFGIFLFIIGLFVFYPFWGRAEQEVSGAVVNRREQLKAELSRLEEEIGEWEKRVGEKQREATSLERDIAILDAQISKAKLQIRARTLAIDSLGRAIGTKEESIGVLSATIARQKESLAESLRTMHEIDDISFIEQLLIYPNFSAMLGEAEHIGMVQKALQESLETLRATRSEEEGVKVSLEKEQGEEFELRALLEIERNQLHKKEKERQNLLAVTKGKESEYKKVLTAKEKDAAAIRTQLFLLQGSPAIPFEKAVAYAELASQKTGVRAAFILGVIAQESELGKNIGQCNLPDDPSQYKWEAVMKASRDHQPFLDITRRLGLDPESMPVSCPMRNSRGERVGWGGAMGPAQFIPSTWVLFESRISAITGNTPPNPWNPKDAFVASGLLLKDNGADYDERKAAAKYFAGSNWNSYLGRSYASQVLAKVATYQDQLDILKKFARRN